MAIYAAKPVFFHEKPKPDYPNLGSVTVKQLVNQQDSQAESQFSGFQNQIPATGHLVLGITPEISSILTDDQTSRGFLPLANPLEL